MIAEDWWGCDRGGTTIVEIKKSALGGHSRTNENVQEAERIGGKQTGDIYKRVRERKERNVKKRNKKGGRRVRDTKTREIMGGRNENSPKQEREKRFEINAKNIEKKDET